MQKSFETGFTIIELITIVVLLSIIAVVAFGRLGNLTDLTDRGYFDQTVSAMRYAQKLAVTTGCEVQVNLTANGFDIHQRQTDCTTGAFTRDVLDPLDRSSPYQLSNPDVSISPAATFQFTAQSTVNSLGADQPFTVNGRQFTVYQFTALVDVP